MPLPPLRYKTSYPETSEVPGQALPFAMKRRHTGTPTNCRRLLRNPPPKPVLPELPTPAEIRDFPDMPLYSFQIDAIRKGLSVRGVQLWHAPGAGKTRTAIYLALCEPGPIIVVTNANVREQFRREFVRWSTVEPVLLEGQTATAISPDTRCVITSWEILPHWREALIEWARGRGTTVVFDEIHKAKSYKRTEKVVNPRTRKADWQPNYTSRSFVAANLSQHCGRRIGLTATPFRNVLADLWSQLDIIEPYCWGVNYVNPGTGAYGWANRYADARPGEFGLDTSGRSNTGELNKRLKEVVHVVSAARLQAELPPKRRDTVYIKVADQTSPGDFRTELKLAARNGTNAIFEVRLMEAAARKRDWIAGYVAERVNGTKQKVTVFTGRRADVGRLAAAIEKKTKGVQLWQAHGEDSPEMRQQIARSYAVHDGPCVLVGTVDAFGESIDGLQHTDVALFAMIPWTHGVVEQAEGRFVRLGQDRPVLILYVVAEGTVDEHVADLLMQKLDAVDDSVARLGVQAEAGATAEGLMGLLSDEEMTRILLEGA